MIFAVVTLFFWRSHIKNFPVKYKRSFKNFCIIAWENLEEISEKVRGNFNEFLQTENLYKV